MEKIIYSNGTERENKSDMDVYSLIRSPDVREYYRGKNVCDNWEKKVLLIQHSFISVQQKMAMLEQLFKTGTTKENHLTEEICFIYSQYIDMIYHPTIRTLFIMETGDQQWYRGQINSNLSLDNVHESLDETIAQMEELYQGENREKYFAHVTVLHLPMDKKAKEMLQFNLFWIDDKWKIKDFNVNEDDLHSQGISDNAIYFFTCDSGMQYHPLPFENGCRLKLQLPFMEKPAYGTLESELDGNGCWYHFLCLDEGWIDCELVSLTDAEINMTSGYSSLDWIERA